MGGLTWSWRNVAFGIVLAVPAALATALDPATGLPLAIGVLPAMALGVIGSRRGRFVVVRAGVVAGVALLLGSIAAPVPAAAVLLLFVLCVVVALAVSADRPVAPLALMLGLPLYGAGLSQEGWQGGLAAGLLIVAGSLYAWLVSLLWTERPAAERPASARIPWHIMLVYGVQIGLAGSLAAVVGFVLDADHPGWGATSALLVSRQQRRQLDRRAVGRVVSVVLGSVLAGLIAIASPPPGAFAALVLVVVGAGTAVAGSRWYVLPFFSTVLVLSLLVIGTPAGLHWYVERIGLTIVGVGLALLFAWLVPLASRRQEGAR